MRLKHIDSILIFKWWNTSFQIIMQFPSTIKGKLLHSLIIHFISGGLWCPFYIQWEDALCMSTHPHRNTTYIVWSDRKTDIHVYWGIVLPRYSSGSYSLFIKGSSSFLSFWITALYIFWKVVDPVYRYISSVLFIQFFFSFLKLLLRKQKYRGKKKHIINFKCFLSFSFTSLLLLLPCQAVSYQAKVSVLSIIAIATQHKNMPNVQDG